MSFENGAGKICMRCYHYQEHQHETAFGNWSGTCRKFKVGRNPYTPACEKFSDEAPKRRTKVIGNRVVVP
jgi:hypothetical protein